MDRDERDRGFQGLKRVWEREWERGDADGGKNQAHQGQGQGCSH